MASGKLLIANSSDDFLITMSQILGQRYLITLCRDGKSALDLLRREQFDLILLDLMLPQLDGISLLECAQREGCCPPSLALTPILNAYVMDAVRTYDIQYMLRTPCDLQSLAARVEDLMRPRVSHVPMDHRKQVSQWLMELGLAPNLDGYQFLTDCILQFYLRPDQRFTKELYPDVGKLSGRSGKQVERCIRNAMDIAWDIGPKEKWMAEFHCSDSRPSASHVISRLAERLRQLDAGK